jgi:hypothetical protein
MPHHTLTPPTAIGQEDAAPLSIWVRETPVATFVVEKARAEK